MLLRASSLLVLGLVVSVSVADAQRTGASGLDPIRTLTRGPSADGVSLIEGRVVDAAGEPLAGAYVIIRDRGVGGPASESGGFRYRGLEAGTYQLDVRRLGYHAERISLRVGEGETVRFVVALQLAPIALEGLDIVAPGGDAVSRIGGFYQRRERGRGHFFTRADIEKSGSAVVRDVVASLPRARLVLIDGREVIRLRGYRDPMPRRREAMREVQMYGGRAFVEPLPGMRGAAGETMTDLTDGDCPPLFYVDGMPFDPTLDEQPQNLRPEQVEGIEVYEAGHVPIQFRQRGAECGVIVIWTRSKWNF